MHSLTTTDLGSSVSYADPFIGPVQYLDSVVLDVSGLTSDEIDADGFLKPGVPIKSDGTLVDGGHQVVYGIVWQAMKVAESNSDAHIAAAADPTISVVVMGYASEDKIEDNLGRAISANEKTAIANCKGLKLRLTSPATAADEADYNIGPVSITLGTADVIVLVPCPQGGTVVKATAILQGTTTDTAEETVTLYDAADDAMTGGTLAVPSGSATLFLVSCTPTANNVIAAGSYFYGKTDGANGQAPALIIEFQLEVTT